MGLRKIAAIPLYILGFMVIGLLSGYLTFKILSFSKTVEVPDLRNKSLVEANSLLSKQSLHLKVEGEEFDSLVAPGLIVRQDVPPGNTVKEQRGIKVFLSKGPRVLHIPDLTGQTLEDAEALVSKSGLRFSKVIRVHSNAVETDRVIAQRPTTDEVSGSGSPQKIQEAPQRHSLTLVVSAGRYDALYYCPDFTGKTQEEAVSIAEKLGIILEFSGTGDKIKTQKQKAHTIIKTGDIVNLQLEGG